ncbi:hypothetical protein ABH965_005828 [Bacillus sp. RC97]
MRSILGFKSYQTAMFILHGAKTIHMVKKAQIGIQNHNRLIHQLFALTA